MKPLLLSFLFIALTSCASPPPYVEYTLARTALRAARDSGAPRFAAGFWHEAEQAYRDGRLSFEENRNEEARNHFKEALEWAEKAENATKIKRFQSGQGLP